MPAAYHPRPRRGWLNDPNGMIFRGGRWHVFFQHNPAAARHHAIAWGHLSSEDLVRWHAHPVAFGPEPGAVDAFGCWSGVATDLGDHVAVLYTGAEVTPADTTVCLRRSLDDDLETWSAPQVVAAQAQVPAEVGLVEMRDPFLLEAGGRRWALLGAALSVEGERRPALLLWDASDLEHWEFAGVWLDHTDPVLAGCAPAQIWECPQLLDVDGTAVLLVSRWVDDRLEGVAQVLGELGVDEQGRPSFAARAGGDLDSGPSCYAPQVAVDDDGPWLLGWVKEDGVPQRTDGTDDPDAQVGCLTLVRRPVLVEDDVRWRTDPRCEALLGDPVAWADGDEVPAAAQVVVPRGGRLERGGTSLDLPPGAQAWVDGDVVETYPGDAVPATTRAAGSGGWRLSAQQARVRVVRTP
ncbi:glycoside hydrolase family 32 protein [Lapillicoccus jejuensis]|uniref:beta-fructofuranosidase n=1 Tax=Lapillicoccus jejuensis TaxID=402171 RepID=A0A542E066_9MICO|nr:glycoside hydrolase family 32 protein [Lapillicoccus jejuensis]TQJ08742.1 beta-fructofuranosidase [Lapillicoccus jejuensis]